MARYYSDENGNLKKYTETSTKKKKKDDDWFKSGAFGDGKGNLFTDALLTIGAFAGDVTINALQGLAGLGEVFLRYERFL